MRITSFGKKVYFKSSSGYICAEDDRSKISLDRANPGLWESFHIVDREKAILLQELYRSADLERMRFAERVLKLKKDGKPVKIYFGCGEVPIPGFINVDIEIMAPDFAVDNYDSYFIFPYIGVNLPIDGNSVDYVFHEDLIEHVDQLSQIQFLAEVHRVLRPDCWHRVNTPNLLHAMNTGSDFTRGAQGVYTGELQWGHIALMTPDYLEQIAKMIGYRQVIFNSKGRGESKFMYPDRRPGIDRDEVHGNIYADLQK